MTDDDVYVRQEAARKLGEAGDPRAVDGLRGLLKDPEDDVRTAGAEALGQIGPGASGAALDLTLAASDVSLEEFPHSPDAATEALTKIGLSAVPTLVDALADDRSVAAAAFALGHMGPAAIPALTEALQRGSKTAANALLAMGDRARSAAPALKRALAREQDVGTRQKIQEALRRLEN